ncbi:MAG: hypothetical protein V7631_1340 [Massilia sp.]
MSPTLRTILFLLASFLVLFAMGCFLVRSYEKRKAASTTSDTEERLFNSYQAFLNDQVGLFSFTFALAALGTGSPQFYATVSLALVLITWFRGARRYKTFIKILELKRHPYLSSVSIFLHFPTFLIGYLALLLVIFGILEKSTMKATMLFFNF